MRESERPRFLPVSYPFDSGNSEKCVMMNLLCMIGQRTKHQIPQKIWTKRKSGFVSHFLLYGAADGT